MQWLQVHAEVPRDQVQRVEEALESLGALSVILDDAGDQPLLEPKPGETPLWDRVIVTGLFDGDAEPDLIEGLLVAQLPAVGVTHDYLDNQVWERAWMDHYEPIQCGPAFWIVPEWLEPPDPRATNLRLDPGLAFGTGNHASTFLCLQWLGHADLKDKVVIDYGCGSGILGVAALLLGAKRVLATDIDPQAVLATRQNAELNCVADRIWVGLPDEFTAQLQDQLPASQADVIVANILAGPLMELAPTFARLCRSAGEIVLAGLIDEQVADLQATYAPWFDLSKIERREENWCRLSGQRL